MDSLADPKELADVEGLNSTDTASVPSAQEGRTAPTQEMGPSTTAELQSVKKKKRKILAQRLGPKKLVRQTVSGVKGAADKVESLVRGDSWTRKHRARRSSVDPVTMAADTAYRRRTKDLETLVSAVMPVCMCQQRNGGIQVIFSCTWSPVTI